MKFNRLETHAFRGLPEETLTFSEGVNVIQGPNGAGKTSILEALYFLVAGKSFRTSSVKSLIPHNGEALLLFADIEGLGALGVHKVAQQRAQVKLNKAPILNAHDRLSREVPILRIDADTFLLISGGPEARRRLVDWGCHQNNNDFLTLWRRYQRAMKQRNQLLARQGADYLLEPWEKEMAQTGEKLHDMRRLYTAAVLEHYRAYLAPQIGLGDILATFDPGWSIEGGLGEVLKADRNKDRILGYANQGPHRFDVALMVGGRPAAQVLSRGQQKLVAAALVLAQYQQLKDIKNKDSIILMDDLWAELDEQHAKALFLWMQALPTQVFLTAISLGPLSGWLDDKASIHSLSS